MKTNTKVALLLGAAAVMGGTGLAMAQMDGPTPPDGPMQGLMHRERLNERLLADFDTNHDGKITHAEFNNVLGSRFAVATHGTKLMSVDQFWSIHQTDFAKHSTEMFRRVDWNGDGKLTLEEFAAPQRAHFEMMDSDGSGSVSCNPAQRAAFRSGPPPPDGPPRSDAGGWRGRSDHGAKGDWRGGRGYGGFGRARFCSEADASRDGIVTRAEFDTITAKAFAAATNGTSTMTLAQFNAEQATRYRDMNAKMFKRLDKDGDGKLTLTEFAAPPEKMFDRLDRNHDGVITADEMKSRFGGRERGGRTFGRRGGRPPRPDRSD
jgi:Ca2+-binding EF-hand superfamily protein